MRSGLLSEESLLENDKIRHLRTELVNEQGLDESPSFYHYHVNKVRYFPKLESFNLLGTCPSGNVWIVNADTGEWIDEETSGVYQDYIDTNWGMHDDYTWVVDDEEEVEKKVRMEAVKRLQIPLPRMAI
ncbi:hypothetical protein VE02_04634 [Pseudogymnoascus sp. 03VT05]|nr:hypothetical protein VE02_04634 [Pseudogymnoascus sp. 03VT05]